MRPKEDSARTPKKGSAPDGMASTVGTFTAGFGVLLLGAALILGGVEFGSWQFPHSPVFGVFAGVGGLCMMLGAGMNIRRRK